MPDWRMHRGQRMLSVSGVYKDNLKAYLLPASDSVQHPADLDI